MQQKKIIVTLAFFTILIAVSPIGSAQFTQTIRGNVIDQVVQTPLSGATITLVSGVEHKKVITDSAGNFRLNNVPVGSQQLRISYIGYKEILLNNIIVNAGKEIVLTIPMETNVRSNTEVIVRANAKRNNPLNDMSMVSARAFTVEETQKYAAAINDPLRMVTSFPGVMSASDGNNDIVIRGNSPTGLLWRMEGVDIPNPNHFASAGSTGGGISILSAQLLANSDFITGAFAAEYGNALSGAFDLKLRKGNNEKNEYTVQAGLLGLNVAAEGPLRLFGKGSYLINYRYSTLKLLDKLGLQLDEGFSTDFQDLSYNFFIPTKKAGTFTLFGFGGLSSSKDADFVKDSLQWENEDDRYTSNFISNTGISALTHNITLNGKTNIKSAVGYSYQKMTDNPLYATQNYDMLDMGKEDYLTKKLIISSTINHKINPSNVLRTGVIFNQINFSYFEGERETPESALQQVINTIGNTQTLQAHLQWQNKAVRNIVLQAGLHYLQLMYNNKMALEPRASVKWDFHPKQSIALAYGQHSQIQALGVYFAETKSNNQTQQPNKNLDFTKAHHFVASYNYAFAKNLRFKAEAYYQHLYNVPVSNSDTSTFSLLNVQDGYVTAALVNKGTGRNYGLELSLEKYLSNQFYFMMSTSLYQSKYKALDGIERNTRYNGNYTGNFLAGKEFTTSNQRRTYGINIKTIYAGGFRTTPIDIVQSQQKESTVYKEKEAFSLQNPDYFRTDVRLSIKWNRKKLTSTLSLDIQNVTNRLNVDDYSYNPLKNEISTSYQNGLIPVLNYKIEF